MSHRPSGNQVCHYQRSSSSTTKVEDFYMLSPEMTRNLPDGVVRNYQLRVPCYGSATSGYHCCGELAVSRRHTGFLIVTVSCDSS